MKGKTVSGFKYFAILIIIILSLWALFITVKSRYFIVSEIVINGNKRVSSSEIIKRSGLRAGITSMFFFESKISGNILENPWITDVFIQKEYPGKIFIDIDESEPFCIVLDKNGKPYYINKNGVKLGPAIIKEGFDFPIILSDGILYSDILDQAIEVLNLSKSSSILNWKGISEVNVSKEHGLRLITVDKRLIEFGKGNITNKWYKVEKIISHVRTKNLSENYINISSESIGVVDFNI